MAHALASAGHQVTVISLAVDGETFSDDDGVEVHRVSPRPNWNSVPALWRLNRIWPGFAWAAMRRVRKIHRRRPIDIVEAAEGRADSFFVSYLPGRPKLVTRLHTARIFVDRLNTVQDSESHRWEYWLEKKSILRANLLTAPSQAVVDLTRTWLPFADEVHVVPNPVDENKFRPGERGPRPGSPAGVLESAPKKIVVYAGRLERRKGIDIIARAIPAVLEKFPEAEFLFIGSDSVDSDGRKWSEKLLEAVSPAQRGRVRFEQKSRDSLIQAYQEATVCILPSVWENFPYALLEPMSCGTPVVATRCGGFPELIESGVSGFLVPVGDAEALAKQIGELLAQPQLRSDIGRNARRRVEERFSAAQVLPSMVAAYEQAISRN